MNWQTQLREKLLHAYSASQTDQLVKQIESRLEQGAVSRSDRAQTGLTQSGNGQPKWLDQCDALLITYADTLQRDGERPLQTLKTFVESHLEGFSCVHLLPFFPWSSDDGFSVKDYYGVDEACGKWDDIRALAESKQLMFDAVINHASAEGNWFKAYRDGDPEFDDFFFAPDATFDISQVFRPRALPLLSTFEMADGQKRRLWTTFSNDQVDLNYANPNVFAAIADVLLFYVEQGARLIRLDAIGFMWKQSGGECVHLPQTHALIQAMRIVLEQAAPELLIITETNVPHDLNISYFGDGDEAHLVYNFSLPPLTLHTLHSGDSTALSRWAKTLTLKHPRTTFLNFLSSHDGIGVVPARGLLDDEQLQTIVARVEANRGLVSYRNNADGSQSPYELNITYLDALRDPSLAAQQPDGEDPLLVERFVAALGILLSLSGLPAIYIHSLLGSRNDLAGVAATGRNRSINREKLQLDPLLDELRREGSVRQQVFDALRHMLAIRSTLPAMAPGATQQVADAGTAVFALQREADESRVLCLINVTATTQVMDLTAQKEFDVAAVDALDGEHVSGSCELKPYQVRWLCARP